MTDKEATGITMSILVTDRQTCSVEDEKKHREYLCNNSHCRRPVSLLAQNWRLEKGQVKGIVDLGQLRTCFKNLGSAYCLVLYGSECFCVGQALETLTNPNYNHHPDIADTLHKVHRYKYHFARADSEPKVTIVEESGEIMIEDGDKTAIAAYLYALEMGDREFILPVYYISQPSTPPPPPQAGS